MLRVEIWTCIFPGASWVASSTWPWRYCQRSLCSAAGWGHHLYISLFVIWRLERPEIMIEMTWDCPEYWRVTVCQSDSLGKSMLWSQEGPHTEFQASWDCGHCHYLGPGWSRGGRRVQVLSLSLSLSSHIWCAGLVRRKVKLLTPASPLHYHRVFHFISPGLLPGLETGWTFSTWWWCSLFLFVFGVDQPHRVWRQLEGNSISSFLIYIRKSAVLIYCTV